LIRFIRLSESGVEDVTAELIEIGYRSLSVSAKLIPALKERIRLIKT